MTSVTAPAPPFAGQADPKPRLWTADEFQRLLESGFFLDPRLELIDGVITTRDSAKARSWTADEVYRLSDLGFFQDQRVELIGGEILLMSPQLNIHALGITLTADALSVIFALGYWVRVQMTLDLSPLSLADPDVAIVRGSPRSHASNRANPTTALLVAEISESTLSYDRGRKASLYAASAIQDYWIINLVHKQVEVHRNPVADPSQPFGWHYADVTILHQGEFIIPLAAPQSKVAVDDLLP
jgi:Uma2 family endonuclease